MPVILRWLRNNVIALVALFVAMGTGGAYAASRLAANSVGTAQLKNNAVISSKVKDHSLKSVDFAQGQLPAGPQGAKGDAGPAGPRGATGLRGLPGAQGPVGPSDAYYDSVFNVELPSDNSSTTVASQTLPSTGGSAAVVMAKLTEAGGGDDVQVVCNLDINGQSVDEQGQFSRAHQVGSMSLLGYANSSNPKVSVVCFQEQGSSSAVVQNVQLITIKVGSLSQLTS